MRTIVFTAIKTYSETGSKDGVVLNIHNNNNNTKVNNMSLYHGAILLDNCKSVLAGSSGRPHEDNQIHYRH